MSEMVMPDQSSGANADEKRKNMLLFWGCFAALIATAFGFQVRAMLMETWGTEFGIDKTQQGEIFGAGLWPFAISIILFSLIIDRIGYGKAMIFAGICHIVQALMLWKATNYEMLYWGSIIGALGNGTVEAVINPVVATIFSKNKTKWLAILHAGWPGGLVIAGLLFMGVAEKNEAGMIVNYTTIILLTLVPVLIYAAMLVGKSFPIQERVKAGVSFKEMLQEPGVLSWAIACLLIVMEVGRVFDLDMTIKIIMFSAMVLPYAAYVQSLGRPMFVFLSLVMCLLATTELGTDSWITPLMEGEFANAGINAGWILVYTSMIMMVLRFFAGPIVHHLPPVKLLACSAALAAIGLFLLGSVTGLGLIFLVATIYGFGKTFFWPATLGIVSERFPKSGALGINMIAAIGMLSVGTLGASWLGYVQDKDTSNRLAADNPEIHEMVVTKEGSFLGLVNYKSVDGEKVKQDPGVKTIVDNVQNESKKVVLRTAAVLPVAMLASYILLMFYFKGQGGYSAVELDTGEESTDAVAADDTTAATYGTDAVEDAGTEEDGDPGDETG